MESDHLLTDAANTRRSKNSSQQKHEEATPRVVVLPRLRPQLASQCDDPTRERSPQSLSGRGPPGSGRRSRADGPRGQHLRPANLLRCVLLLVVGGRVHRSPVTHCTISRRLCPHCRPRQGSANTSASPRRWRLDTPCRRRHYRDALLLHLRTRSRRRRLECGECLGCARVGESRV